jgi:predicted amidohydrolase YtcJ
MTGKGDDLLWVSSVAPSSIDGAGTRACTNNRRSVALGVLDKWFPVGQCHTDIEYRGGSGRASNIAGNYFGEFIVTMGDYDLRMANMHAEGDRSVGNVLNMIERMRATNPQAAQNWAMDHCYLVDPKDFQRAARLGVLFVCDPGYVNDGDETAQSYGEQVAHTFISPVGSMMKAGIKVSVEGSGFQPLELFQTRVDNNGKVWGPQERVDRTTALKMPTNHGAAYVLRPDQLGSIQVGKLADLVVIDKDYMTVPVETISDILVQMTIMDGKVVYLHPQFSSEYNMKPATALIATLEQLGAVGGGGD